MQLRFGPLKETSVEQPRRVCRYAAGLIITILILQAAQAVQAQPYPSPRGNKAFLNQGSHVQPGSVDWSKAVVESTMKRYPTASDLGSWGYAKALFLLGEYLVWKRTGDSRYLQYVKSWVDLHVDAQGNLDRKS